MRHDDMIRTAVALANKDSPDARAAAFRQLIDLSLQQRGRDDRRLNWRALRALHRLAKEVPADLRNAMIDKAAKQGARALHLRLFRGSVSHHYDRMLQLAKLDEAEWWRLARRAPAHLHAAMLARRDLPGPVRELLSHPSAGGGAGRLFVADERIADSAATVADKSRFAPPPLAADDSGGSTPAIASSRSQVRELIDRIAAFRAKAQGMPPPAPTSADERPAAEVAPRWTWRCDESGIFVDSPDVPRQLIGYWLSELEGTESAGQLRRALERRVPFRDLVVAMAPTSALTGMWRLSGLPQFERKTGRFTGYWGSAIALEGAKVAVEIEQPGLFGTGASSEVLATMAHEVRTPLNAIIGFAQLIEGEILGEAGEVYREEAGNILKHAEKLLGAFDDLSDAARIEQGRYPVGHESFDPGSHAEDVIRRYESLAAERQVALVPLVAADLPAITGDSSVFERALSRLMTATVASAAAGETIYVVVQRAPAERLRIAVSRPRATLGKSADALFEPSGLVTTEGAAPILGVGFGLKLVDSLVGTVGGSFTLGAHMFEILLPLATERRASEAS